QTSIAAPAGPLAASLDKTAESPLLHILKRTDEEPRIVGVADRHLAFDPASVAPHRQRPQVDLRRRMDGIRIGERATIPHERVRGRTMRIVVHRMRYACVAERDRHGTPGN